MISHVTLGGFLQRLVIPWEIVAISQGLVDNPATSLGAAHLFVKSRKVPARFGLGAQSLQRALMLWVLGKIAKLMRVSLKIKELVRVKGAARLFPFPIALANPRRVACFSRIFHRNGLCALHALPHGFQAHPFGPRHDFLHIHPSEIA